MTDIWNIREQEREALAKVEAQIVTVSAAIELAKRTAALRDASGFADFLKALDDNIAVAKERLVTAKVTNDEMRELRGVTLGMQRVRQLFFPGDNTAALAQHLTQLQNDRVELLKRTPKPQPKGEP